MSFEDLNNFFSIASEKGRTLVMYSISPFQSLRTKKNVANTMNNCKTNDGKLKIILENRLTKEFAELEIKLFKTEPISAKKFSEIVGKRFERIVSKFICCAAR